jgi:hypothetical protein
MMIRSPASARKCPMPRWRRFGPLVVAPVAVAALMAGCGGGGSHHAASSASNDTSAPSSARQSGLAFASCMRAHGVANFPGSAVSVNEGQVQLAVPAGIKGEPQFPSASQACQRDLPGGSLPSKHVNVQQELEYANCMRARGVSDFPDPMPGGGFDITFNTNSPQFEAADNACGAKFP